MMRTRISGSPSRSRTSGSASWPRSRASSSSSVSTRRYIAAWLRAPAARSCPRLGGACGHAPVSPTPRRGRVDDQVGDALLPAFPGSGPDQGEEDVGVARVRRPDLLAVDDVLVAVTAAGGAQAGQVRARFRFRVALRPDHVAAEHRRQPAALLLRGAVLDDRGGGDVQAGAERARYPGSGELLLVDHLARARKIHASHTAPAPRA